MAQTLIGDRTLQLIENSTLVPYPYEVWGDGVYVTKKEATAANPDVTIVLPESLMYGRKKLMYRPLWISGTGYTVDTEEPLVQLRFMHITGQLKEVWVSRGQITDHKLLLQLGAGGLPIDSVNAEDVLMFLRAVEAANTGNPALPCIQVGHRTGPYLVDGKLGWLIGKQWIGEGTMQADPRSNSKYTLAFQSRGSEQAYFDKWRALREISWVNRFLMGAGFAPPLLRLLKCRTFIVHHWGPSSKGKCLDGDTLIPTGRGLQRIKDLDRPTYNPSGFSEIPANRQLTIWNGDKWVTATHFFKEKAERTLRVVTRRGYEVIATPEHPLWTQRGWVKSEKLVPGVDKVRVAPVEFTKKHSVFMQVAGEQVEKGHSIPDFTIDIRVARLLGVLIADGTNTYSAGLRITSARGVLEDLQATCRDVFGLTTRIIPQPENNTFTLNISSVVLRRIMARCGLTYTTAAGKTVPDVILRSPASVIRAFLRGYFECDGAFDRHCIQVTSASEQLSREVQVLLLGCGMASTRSLHPVLYKGERRPYWRVSITSGEGIFAFASSIGVMTPEREVQLGLALVTALDHTNMRRAALPVDDDFFDEIASVTEAGSRMVYDLTIPDGHAFSANGIVSHNTALQNMIIALWGNPELLVSTLNRTEISITEIFRHMTDVPVIYDEKQVSTVNHSQLIYAICTGQGRERGSKDGGLRQDRQQWLTVARTTGEGPLIPESDLGGQFNRVLQINSQAFTDSHDAEALYPFTAENHGFAGPAFLKKLGELLNAKPAEGQLSGLEQLQALCQSFRTQLAARAGIDGNHAQYCAIIATAQTLSESWLLGIPLVEAMERALDDATLALQETAAKKQPSYAEKALAKLRDHWISNPNFYVDDTSAEGRKKEKFVYKMIGVEHALGMAFIPHEANALLEASMYEPERVWRDFRLNGWLILTDDGNPLLPWALRNNRSPDHPCYVVRRDIFFTDTVRQTKLRVIDGGLSNILGLQVS